jgi:hypothetical protein
MTDKHDKDEPKHDERKKRDAENAAFYWLAVETQQRQEQLFAEAVAVDPNTVPGGVPFVPDTRTIAEQIAALTPGG